MAPRARPASTRRSRPIPSADTPTPRLFKFGLTPERPIATGLYLGEHVPGATGADMHAALELGFVVSGQMRRDHGRGWFRMGPGQALASGPLEPHKHRAGYGRVRCVYFQLIPSVLARLPRLGGFDPTVPFRSPARFGAIGTDRALRRAMVSLGRELAPKYSTQLAPGPVTVDLLRVLELVCQGVDASAAPGQPLPGGLFATSRIEPALELIERSLDRMVRVAEAAHACAMAPSTFRAVFQDTVGLSFARFALRYRLAAASQVLRTTDLPVKAVAYRFGFTDGSHFHRAFAAHYGVSPGRYRALPTP